MTIYQRPNAILIISLLALAGSKFLPHPFDGYAYALEVTAFSAWAYDEIRRGDGPFRRVLGGVVAIYMVISLALRLT
jgi:hypothetical protein